MSDRPFIQTVFGAIIVGLLIAVAGELITSWIKEEYKGHLRVNGSARSDGVSSPLIAPAITEPIHKAANRISQPARQPTREAKPAEIPAAVAPPGCGLGSLWRESELDWTGTWKRRGESNLFNGHWTLGNQVDDAVLTINIVANRVSIQRVDVRGDSQCEYKGTMDKDMRTVTGTYQCSFSPLVPTWKATIICK